MKRAPLKNDAGFNAGTNQNSMPGFADSPADELQYCFALSSALIEQRLPQANESQSLRLRLLQEMMIEQLPSLRPQEAGAK